MPAQVTILAGPPHSGKTTHLLDRYRAALAENLPGSALWLAPTHRSAADVRGRLLDGGLGECFSPGVTTFEKFAEAILQTAPEAIQPVGRAMQRQLVRRLIDRQQAGGRLRHFGPIAATGGLVELVCGWIRELKRLEIWPEHFREACRRLGLTDKDRELLEIYEAYQQALREHELYDPEGRFWSARDWLDRCREAARPWPTPWDRLRLVVADGFTDFTRTQHEILQRLAERVEEVLVSLPLEEGAGREELFGKPRKTLAEFERRFGTPSSTGVSPVEDGAHGRDARATLRVEWHARPERPVWPAMDHLEKALFADPRRRPPPPENIEGIEILAAAGRHGELRTIAARIKELLLSGEARPGDVAVVLRSPSQSASLVREAFGRLGVPVAVEAGEPLGRSPALRALAGLLRLDLDDWPAEGLLAVLRSNYFRPPGIAWNDPAVAATERALRELQVARGRGELLGELEGAGLDAVERLATALDELPERAMPAGWAAAWRRLAEQTGLLAVMAEPLDAPSLFGTTDLEAWNALIDALAEGERLSAWLGERPTELGRPEALGALDDLLAAETIGLGSDESGSVRVLSAQSVRALRVPYLFVAGLAEQSFPMPEPQSRLYGEAEAARLIEAGLPLVARSERSGEEMLLFYEVLSRASRRLVLSYPALDDKGEPLSPSPYLTEVEQAFAPARIARSEHVDLSPLPPEPDPLCASDFRLRAVDAALGGDESLLAGLARIGATAGLSSSAQDQLAAMADNLLAALRLAWLRQQRDGFGPAEGMFVEEGLRGALASEYGPERVFAATDLESYATCPFRFLLERILRLGSLEEFDVESDAAERGLLAHALLANFHRRVNRELGRPGSPLELAEEQYERLLDQAFAAALSPEPRSPVKQTLREVDRRVLRGWMAGYRDQLAAYEQRWKDWEAPPAAELFEASFGRAPRRVAPSAGDNLADAADAADPASTAEPLECTVGNETIRVSGRIDRIDSGRAGGTPVFNVIDYKTGSPPKFQYEEAERGLQLQLPLYAIAAAELLLGGRNPVPWAAGYWRLREKGFHHGGALIMYRLGKKGVEPEEAWDEFRLKLPAIVAGLIAGIRRGEFPVYSENDRCTGTCPMSTICRIGQVRSLEKTWEPTRASEPPTEN
jgi:ATP-dependent helicase/nuclease subunit B